MSGLLMLTAACLTSSWTTRCVGNASLLYYFWGSRLIEINIPVSPCRCPESVIDLSKLNNGNLRHGFEHPTERIHASNSSHHEFRTQSFALHDFQSLCFRHSTARHKVFGPMQTAEATGLLSTTYERSPVVLDCQYGNSVRASAVWWLVAGSCRRSPWEYLGLEVLRLP